MDRFQFADAWLKSGDDRFRYFVRYPGMNSWLVIEDGEAFTLLQLVHMKCEFSFTFPE